MQSAVHVCVTLCSEVSVTNVDYMVHEKQHVWLVLCGAEGYRGAESSKAIAKHMHACLWPAERDARMHSAYILLTGILYRCNCKQDCAK